MVSNIVHRRGGLDPVAERALFRGTVGEAAAVEFSAFLKVWHELPHPRTVIDDPEGAVIPGNASALIALCGSLYRMADDINLGAIVTYATRLIAMDEVPSKGRVLDYGMRWGIEPMFSDFKSRGFSITKTQLRHADRIERLLLILTVALYWAVSTGMAPPEKPPTRSQKKQRGA